MSDRKEVLIVTRIINATSGESVLLVEAWVRADANAAWQWDRDGEYWCLYTHSEVDEALQRAAILQCYPRAATEGRRRGEASGEWSNQCILPIVDPVFLAAFVAAKEAQDRLVAARDTMLGPVDGIVIEVKP